MNTNVASRTVGQRRGRTAGIALLAALLFISGVAALGAPASAEGSRDLYPGAGAPTCQANSLAGSCRANLEWRTSAYGPTAGQTIRRRTLLYVYLKAGEELLLGSSAMGVAGTSVGDAIVYNPGVITSANANDLNLPAVTSFPAVGSNGFKCSTQRAASGIAAQGQITSRAQEAAGPQAVSGGGNPTGYVPCHYTAATTGIYNLAFYGPNGSNDNADATVAADVGLTNANDFNANQKSSVAAWDATVRANQTTTANIDGRMFTYALAAFTSKNAAPVNASFYVTTTDGFKYRTDTRGLDPNGFLIYGNQVGFLDKDGVTPLYHDVLGLTGGAEMTTVSGGVTFSPPTYPLSFQPLAAEVLTALAIPATPVAPSISGISFAGNVVGNTSVFGGGGTFSYTSTAGGVYEIVVSQNGVNFDPGLPTNRVLRGVRSAGTSTITWDGKDNAGNNFPVGVNYPFKATLQAGAYHFPLVDAENSTLGGPTFTLLNPPGGVCPFGNAACTTAFYDDRGYHTIGAGGSDVGTPGTVLCGNGAPTVPNSDPVTGYISSTNQRAYGADSGGNTNASCTGSFGDVKGLDTWTFYPSSAVSSTLNIVGAPISGRVYFDTNNNGVYDSGEPGISGVTVTVRDNTNTVVGTLTTASDGTYTFTPTATGTYSITETQPAAYNNGSTTAGTGGGTTTGSDDKVATIAYVSTTAISGYNFGELGAPIAGKVFVDGTNAPLQNVTITLKDSTNATVGTTTTLANGTYSFANIAPGSYTILETQPAGYAPGVVNPSNSIAVTQTKAGLAGQDFSEALSSIAGKVFVDGTNAPLQNVTITLKNSLNVTVGTTTTAADGSYSFTGLTSGSYTILETQPAGYGAGAVVPLNSIAATLTGNALTGQDFSEKIGSFSGTVFFDKNANGALNVGEPGIGGVTVTLTGTDANAQAVNRTTTSAADGTYSFANVIGGTYTVTETQPAAYNNGTTTAGSAGGTTTGSNDIVSAIALGAGVDGTGYTFGELGGPITGKVFVDGTNAPLQNVTITLRDSLSNVVGTTTTAADGTYSFANIAPGTYTVTETQPAGYGPGVVVPGNVINVTQTKTGSANQNFSETTGVFQGTVFFDKNANGALNGGEPGIGGVTVTLTGTDVNGPVSLTTTTASDGTYSFGGLLSGTYTVTETQPAAYNNGATIAGSAGGTTTGSNDIVANVTFAAGSTASGYNFGELGGPIAGKVFVDGTNAPLAGVTITLRDGSNTVVGTTTTAADGSYSFGNIAPGAYTVTETQPTGYGAGAVTPGNVINVTHTKTGEAGQDFSEKIGSFAGTVFFDKNANGAQNAGEPGIAGVTVTLTGTDANAQAVNRTTTTAADGTYSFANVIGGTYTITETQPAAYNNGTTTAGSAGGTTTGSNDIVSAIALTAGADGTGYTFGELSGPISGKVFVDGSNLPLAGVTITLKDSTNATVGTTTTAADGTYSFGSIAPGTYTIVETQPAGYAAGVVNPSNSIAVNQTKAGLTNQNFSEAAGTFSGTVYFDKNANGALNGGEPGIGGVTVTLTGTDANGPVSLTTTTAGDGTYSFGGLLSGTYTVTETQPAAYNNGTTTAGSAGGTTTGSNDIVANVTFAAGATASGYTFGELGGPIAGKVFVDGTNAPLQNVTITLRDGSNAVVGTTTTAADGSYSFTNIPPGTYTVTETQPTGYGPGVVVPGNVINLTHTKTGEAGQSFSEKIGSVSGTVYFDKNANGALNAGEPGIGGVTVTLTGTDANAQAVNRTTTSAADGTYSFANVLAGTYTVTETQPAAYNNGTTTAGSAGGTTTGSNDIVSAIPLGAGVDGTGYTFGELGGPVSGKVFVDGSNTPIAGVTITLKDSTNATVATTTTAADGTYNFANVAPGTYTILETQPAGYGPGVVNPSNSIAATVTKTGLANQDFSETLGGLSGRVYFDANTNGSYDSGEPGIGGVTVTLTGTDTNGAVNLTTTTAADGTYSFTGLLSGTYKVAETQPAAYNNGTTTAGTSGGTTTGTDDQVAAITFSAGSSATGYTFGELGSAISGKVYQEVTNTPIAGVTITLKDGLGNVVGTTTTAADGSYSFPGLPAGSYSIVETQPAIWNSVSPNTLNVTLPLTGLVNQDFIENYPPTAVDDYRSAPTGTPTVIDPLVNDTDPETDNLTITVVTPPSSGGTVTINAGSKTVTYTSPVGFTGYDVFTYTIIDGKGGSSTAKVHLFVDASTVIGNDKMYYFGIGGTTPAATPSLVKGTYDQLAVSGAIRLSSQQLVIKLRNGFVPSAGDTFDVFTATSFGGAFAKVYGQVMPNGLVLAVHYMPDRIRLVAEKAFYVDTLVDTVDATPGDGICATAAGECSLRAAVQEADAGPNVGIAIVLMPTKVHQLSIAGNDEDQAVTGDLDLKRNIDVLGQGATVNAGALDRAFHILGEANVTMTSLTLTNGFVTTGRVAGAGALFNEGGTLFLVDVNLTNSTGSVGGGLGTQFGTTTLERGVISGNTASIGGGAAVLGSTLLDAVVVNANTATTFGGGLAAANFGVLTVNNANVSSNTAPTGGGVGSTSPSTVVIARSTFSANTATQKGGGLATNGTASFTDTRVTGNTAPEGAGVYNLGTLTLLRSTYDANVSTVRGGGLVNEGTMTINQSTLSGNQSPTGSGLVGVSGTIAVTNSTITKNKATSGATVISPTGAGIISFGNSIVADQVQGASCAPPLTGITSLGYNLSSDATCGFTFTGDAQNLSALLGALAGNGGWSPTHRPLAGSPAIGSGNPTCTGPDQRGYPRPRGGACEKGSVEL